MAIKYAVGLPNVGEFGDVHTLLGLAVSAERHGWDGVHLWDHLLYPEPGWAVTSPVVAAAAIAAATSRIRIILTLTLPRRQIQDVAQDTAAIDILSQRRLTILAIIGSMDSEFSEFGLDPGLRARGRALDDGLARITELWRQWDFPRIPIWCGGRWPRRPGLRRASRFEGVLPTFADQRSANVPASDFGSAASFARPQAVEGFDIALEGATQGPSAELERYAELGMTWWIEAMGWWRGGSTAAAARIAQGPPRI